MLFDLCVSVKSTHFASGVFPTFFTTVENWFFEPSFLVIPVIVRHMMFAKDPIAFRTCVMFPNAFLVFEKAIL